MPFSFHSFWFHDVMPYIRHSKWFESGHLTVISVGVFCVFWLLLKVRAFKKKRRTRLNSGNEPTYRKLIDLGKKQNEL